MAWGRRSLDEAQLRSLGSPVRREVFTTLGEIGPASVAEVAAALHQQADALYYHLRHLLRVGLVRDLGKRPAATRPESVYAVASKLVRTDTEARSPSYLAALQRMFASVLRTIARRLSAALEEPDTVRSGPQRQVTLRTQLVRLDDVALGELNRKLDELSKFVGDRSLDEGGELYQVVTVATVLPRKRPR